MPRSPGSMHLDRCGGGIDVTEIIGGEFDCRRADVLLQALHPARAGDRHNPRLLRQQPRERDLRRRRIPLSSNLFPYTELVLTGFHFVRGHTRDPATDLSATIR